MKLGSFFVTGKRDNGDTFVTLKDERPEWLQEAVYAAHAGDLPNDWVYSECRAACEAIDADELSEDDVHEYADGRVDIYTKELFQWAADHCLSSIYSNAEGETEDYGFTNEPIEKRLAILQFYAIRAIAETMRAAVETNASEEAVGT